MKKLLFCLLILATIISCKKSTDNDYFTISGIVLDYDNLTPIQTASVIFIPSNPESIISDSVLTDINGRFSFTYKKDKSIGSLNPKKNNYISPYNYSWSSFSLRDTLYLSKSSYVNLTLHSQVIYNSNDSLYLTAFSNRRDFSRVNGQEFIWKQGFYNFGKLAATADTTISNVPVAYFATPYNKIYVEYKIIRNGVILSSHTDSTDLVQYSIKNYTINY